MLGSPVPEKDKQAGNLCERTCGLVMQVHSSMFLEEHLNPPVIGFVHVEMERILQMQTEPWFMLPSLLQSISWLDQRQAVFVSTWYPLSGELISGRKHENHFDTRSHLWAWSGEEEAAVWI